MPPALVLTGVAAGAFLSTNVDAFLLLVANVARAPRSLGAAVAGFVIATALVLGAAWGVALASKAIPPAHVGLVGLVPLGLGLKQAYDLVRRRLARAGGTAEVPVSHPSRRRGEATVRLGEAIVLHLALSADNLAVYSALLTDTLPHLRPVIAATTLSLTLVWAALAAAALRVPYLSGALIRWGHGLMAVLLIGVGIYILADTDTDVLLPSAVRQSHAAAS
jgi:cadmium resistance protein CadD (predicted permease)